MNAYNIIYKFEKKRIRNFFRIVLNSKDDRLPRVEK